MPTRPCLVCGRLHRNASRCDQCQTAHNLARGSSTQRGYGGRWQRISKAVIADWRAAHGGWCPGYQVPGHAAEDLTADHIVPKARGGSDSKDNLAVLCRACNARKRDRISTEL